MRVVSSSLVPSIRTLFPNVETPETVRLPKVPTDVMLGCAAVLTVPAKLPVNVVAVIAPDTFTLSSSV